MSNTQLSSENDRASALRDFLFNTCDSPKDALETLDAVRDLLTQAIDTVSKELLEQALQNVSTTYGDKL